MTVGLPNEAMQPARRRRGAPEPGGGSRGSRDGQRGARLMAKTFGGQPIWPAERAE